MASRVPNSDSPLALIGVPFFVPAFLAVVFSILSEAMAFSYITLLAVERIGMGPVELGAFLSLSALGGIVASTGFGHFYDRRAAMWPLLLSLVAKSAGFALCALRTETWLMLINAAVLIGLGSATFPLLFAIAKHHLDTSHTRTVLRGMMVLRIASSLSWAVGPALAAALIGIGGFLLLYTGAAILAGMALAVVLLTGMKVSPEPSGAQPMTAEVMRTVAPVAVVLTAFHTAMFAGANATAIVVATELGALVDVGLLSSLCAAAEIALMSVFVIRTLHHPNRHLLIVGFLMFSAYFAMLIVHPTLTSFYVGQVFRAAGIAIISVFGMAYIQDLLPGRAGIATALFGNTAGAGLLLSGVGTGLVAHAFDYRSLFVVCFYLCLLSVVALLAAQRVR